MKPHVRGLLVLSVCTGLLASAPVVYGGGNRSADHRDDRKAHDRKDGHWKDMRACDRGGDRDLAVLGVTADGRLVCFEDDRADRVDTLGRITGLVTDTKLVGLDFRPASGADGDAGDLYGVGDQGGIYVIDSSGRATPKSRLNVALSGTSFGVDFNPTVDRLRIVSDTGQNLRVDVDTGVATVDGTLSYTPPTAATGVVASAYTNNDADPNTATTLFDVDTMLDQVVVQSPANAGSLAPTGKLGVDASSPASLDIYATVRDGSTVESTAVATLTVGGASRLYRLDLLTGRAWDRGAFASENQIVAIAVPLNQR